jgi:competence protein ComEC
MRHFWNLVPFLRYLLFLIPGILLRDSFAVSYYSLLCSLIAWGIFQLAIHYNQKHHFVFSLGREGSLYVCFFFLGLLRSEQHYYTTSLDFDTCQYSMLRIESYPEYKTGKYRCQATIFKINNSETQIPIMLQLKGLTEAPEYGDILLTRKKPRPPSDALWDKAFDYKRYLALKGIHFQLYLNEGEYLHLENKAALPILKHIYNWRKHIYRYYAETLSAESLGLTAGVILGIRQDITADVYQDYSRTGAIHLLSVSGMHVAIIAQLLLSLCAFFPTKHRRLWSFFILVSILGVYAMMSGLSPSVCRAVWMFGIVQFGAIWYRKGLSLNTLFLAAFILLLLDPSMIYDIGFQLSFLAVFGLIVVLPLWETYTDWDIAVWKKYTLEQTGIAVAAMSFTFPLAWYYFGQFPWWFIPVNLFVGPIGTILIYFGILHTLLMPLSYINPFSAFLLDITCQVLNGGIRFFSQLSPEASPALVSLPGLLIIMGFLLTSCIWLYEKRNRWLYLSIALSFSYLLFSFQLYTKEKEFIIFGYQEDHGYLLHYHWLDTKVYVFTSDKDAMAPPYQTSGIAWQTGLRVNPKNIVQNHAKSWIRMRKGEDPTILLHAWVDDKKSFTIDAAARLSQVDAFHPILLELP